MSTMEEIHILRDTLYEVGLLETLCFTLTDDKGHWFIVDNNIFYTWHSGSGVNNSWINPWRY